MRVARLLVVALACGLPRAAEAGLTHYWIWRRPPDPAALGRALADIRRLARARPALVTLRERAGKHGPQLIIEGKGEAGYETFVFPGAVHRDPSRPGNEHGAFNFCKTQWRAYDEVVTASLYAARDHFPERVLVISTDSAETWHKGKRLYERVLGRRARRLPLGPSLQTVKEEDERRARAARLVRVCGTERDPLRTTELSCSPAELARDPLEKLTRLQTLRISSGQTPVDLERLVPLRSLRRLEIAYFTKVVSLAPLGRLPRLEELSVGYQALDLGPLTSVRGLRKLSIANVKASSLEPLRGLTQLEELTISENPVVDLGPLAALTRLRKLEARFTRATDLRPLSRLGNLRALALTASPATELSPLAALRRLEVLDLALMRPRSLEPLRALTALRELDLTQVRVRDYAPLGALTALEKLVVSQSGIADFSPLRGLARLRVLRASSCSADPRPLAELKGLEKLDLESNRELRDLSALARLTRLRSLTVANTQIADLRPLAALTRLEELRVHGTRIRDLAPILKLPLRRLVLLSRVRHVPRAQLAELRRRRPGIEIKTRPDL